MYCNHTQVKLSVLKPSNSMYIYFAFIAILTKTTIIGHDTVFHGLIPILRWLHFT